jgi:hypothetical protein
MSHKAEATTFSEFKLKPEIKICGYILDDFNVKTVSACNNIGFKRLIYPQSNFLV